MPSKPKLSVIIPYNGDPNLLQLLESIAKQTLPPDFYEVIVVSDCDDQTNDISRYRLHWIQQKRPPGFVAHTAGLSRNRGASEARGELLVFVDSDCILDSDCLRVHLEIQELRPGIASCGSTSELPAYNWDLLSQSPSPSYIELLRASLPDHRIACKDFETPPTTQYWDYWYTSNAAVPRTAFAAVGGFSELGYRCHDQELAYRLFLSGVRFTFLENARAIHVEHPRALEDRNEHIVGWTHLRKQHPELGAFVHDRVVSAERFIKRVEHDCERKFRQLTFGLQGVRAGRSWILPPGTSEQWISTYLQHQLFRRLNSTHSTKYMLRLHRSCWDYSFIAPNNECANSPIISVIIPAYNAAETVWRAITSVLQQTFQSFEIIVVDDCSSDDTGIVCERFSSDPRVRVVTLLRNGGQSRALNCGLEISRSEFILQLDADDWLEPKALACVIECFRSSQSVGAIYGDPIIHDPHSVNPVEKLGRQLERSEEFYEYANYQVPRAFRRSCLFGVGGWSLGDGSEGRYYEDRRILAAIADQHEVKHLLHSVYNVNSRESSLSRGQPLKAAAVKLSILWQEANRRRLTLLHSFDGQFLTARFGARPQSQTPQSWSVVIPFQRHLEHLRASIASWLQSDLGSRQHEIIIVDDGSGFGEILKVIAKSHHNIRILSSSNCRGPAWARNIGASAAVNEMLFFSDADQIVPTDVITSHENRHALQTKDGIVVGSVFGRRAFTFVNQDCRQEHKLRLLELLQFNPRFDEVASALACGQNVSLIDDSYDNIWCRCQEFAITDSWRSSWGEILINFGDSLEAFTSRWTAVVSASMSVPKRLFNELHGFDDRLLSMEDWEFGIRAQKNMVSIICAPEAEPLHQIHSVDERRIERDQESVTFLIKKHTDFMQSLTGSWGHHRSPAADVIIDTVARCGLDSQSDLNPAPVPVFDYCALTFDDGPHPLGTPLVLDVLERFGCHATFFVLGAEAERYPDLCKRVVAAGHEIGVHAWHHTSPELLTTSEVRDQLIRSIGVTQEITGRRIRYARPPYGALSASYLEALSSLDLTAVGWDISSEDWAAISPRSVIQKLAVSGVRGKIILFHDGAGDPTVTTKVLEWLLRACSQEAIKCAALRRMCDNILNRG